MRTSVLLVTVAAMMVEVPASADTMGGAQIDTAKSEAALAFAEFSRNAPTLVMTYLVRKHPEVFESIDRENSDGCLSTEATPVSVDRACQAALRQIIETIRSLLSASYGLTKRMGRFDQTIVSYSKELTRSLLMMDPLRKI